MAFLIPRARRASIPSCSDGGASRRGGGGAFLALAAASWLLAPHAATQEPTDYAVKAAYVLNFARYAEWPAGAPANSEASFSVCTPGRATPFGGALSAIEGKPVHGREVRVRHNIELDQLHACHLLVIPETEERRLHAILRAAGAHPVLTVSDIEGFAEAGGMIGLVVADRRVRFDVNLPVLRKAQVRLSSDVLRLARAVLGPRI